MQVRVLHWLLSPFIQATTLEQYSNNGYRLLGLASLVVFLCLWSSGYFHYPLSRSTPLLRLFYRFLVERLGLAFIPDSMVSVIVVPVLLYIAIYFYKPTRLLIGESFAKSVFWLTDRAIMAGEWCIEHRWQSLVLIIVLVVLLTAGVVQRFDQASNERILRRDFGDWLTHAEEFVNQNTLAKPEPDRYNHVMRFW
ncbi:MAG TPA: hypothetical protein VLX28_00785, partial [Thermoanaerobaculia bacterium]|nr:hypothetical protein [Thermoanaerobaculia bacterium]